MALCLFVVPFVADAKQVILAAPAILLALRWRTGFWTNVSRSLLLSAR